MSCSERESPWEPAAMQVQQQTSIQRQPLCWEIWHFLSHRECRWNGPYPHSSLKARCHGKSRKHRRTCSLWKEWISSRKNSTASVSPAVSYGKWQKIYPNVSFPTDCTAVLIQHGKGHLGLSLKAWTAISGVLNSKWASSLLGSHSTNWATVQLSYLFGQNKCLLKVFATY